jgi:hypothetical protein
LFPIAEGAERDLVVRGEFFMRNARGAAHPTTGTVRTIVLTNCGICRKLFTERESMRFEWDEEKNR